MNYKAQFAEALQEHLAELSYDSIYQLIEQPKQLSHGDLAFPCFELAKIKRTSPMNIASELAGKVASDLFEKVEAVGPYVNVFLDKRKVGSKVIHDILQKKNHYGDSDRGKDGKVPIDMSSPNIAKPFSMGHLRSTVIGNSIALLLKKSGYQPIRINHLGDWGTQFGKLMVAYKKWGEENKVRQNPIEELLQLYILFHEEAETDPSLVEEGRAWFKRLEDGDTEAESLWKWFREESLKEFNKIYELLGIEFDSTHGEAFYNDKMEEVVKLLEEKSLLTESEGAQVVDLSEHDLPPSLIRKSDGATLYTTRDLAAALYRNRTYDFVRSLYVVGNEQGLHFKQLKLVLEKMGYAWAKDLHHVSFGMILKDGKKMSTRKGKVVLLEEVLREAIDLAKFNMEEKNPGLVDKEEAAKAVGVGAVLFHDLKNHRNNDVEFSLEDMLRIEGETGPYVQYTHARGCSLLEKGNFQAQEGLIDLEEDHTYAWSIISELLSFPNTVKRATEQFDPSIIAKYVVDLAQAFNRYYAHVRVLEDTSKRDHRLALVQAVVLVLEEGLRLLGMKAPKQM
ncbi:arginine--tRNA ligase [Radiobacillus kanasensis]|uniref:arginine--tRNA ligase n=1 Tax=Radiobacillus kanasensis TaxID=2844358 RepID=UPI001E36B472|nr:arginine--tRNA ligase [Radiobacillus kanasensis]UFT99791.1 arginine--tRNA ligase [Radiobacillus kanasensis]